MDDDFIKRSDAIDAVERLNLEYDLDLIKYNLYGVPAADVRPVVHAHWIDEGLHQTCSACGFIHYTDCTYKFCPNCGAVMDEEEHDG